MTDRDWITKTALDPEATRGEFEADRAHSPNSRSSVR
jgi:hypothetical protein